MTPIRRLFLLALPALALACPAPVDTWTEKGPRAEGLDCNPVADDWDCLMPYPSDFYRKRVPATPRLPGGFQLELTEGARPRDHSVQGDPLPFDFFEMFPSDGFSVVPQIGVRLPVPVDTEPLVFHTDDLGEALKPTSHTLLLDAETGEPQPHFAEYDMRPADPAERALVLRPIRRLQNGRRYVVALRSLTQVGGAAIPAPAGFAKIRDGKPDSPLLSRLVEYYGLRVFPVLEKFGVAKSELTLAWDFTTQTFENATGDLLRVRELAMREFEATPPAVADIEFQDLAADASNGEHWGRRVTGRLRVPLFTVVGIPDSQRTPDTSDEDDDAPGARLHRDADGRVAQNGYTEIDFTLIIPRSVVDGTKPRPARLLQFGHGFFGDRGELQGWASRFAHETGMIVMGVDWTGMATADAAVILGDLLGAPEQSMRFIERTHQGIMNFMALTYAAKHTLKDQPALQLDGQPAYDPAAAVEYYGISQGHIMGTTYVATAPHVERAALSVGGGSFGFMMSRSRNFIQFLDPIESTVGGAGNAFRLVMLLQSAIDRVDPITYTPHLLKDTFPGSPATRQAVLQIGLGDAQVPNLASQLQARTLGIPLLTPAPQPVWGFETTPGPAPSAYVEFDFGLVTPPEAKQVEHDNVAHEGVRRTRASIQQIDAFLRPGGQVTNTCLDQETGAPAACRCAEAPGHTCNPAVCVAADDGCDGDTLVRCTASRRERVGTACPNGCNAETKACNP